MRFLSVFLLLAFTPLMHASQPTDAIVRIYAKRGVGTCLGAGAFINADGDILTAYHVIQGATAVEVAGDRLETTAATLVSYDAAWDLAVIHVAFHPETFLDVGAPPASLSHLTGTAIGHPDGKINYQISIAFPTDKPVAAGQYYGPGGATLFKETAVELIPIDATINRGMSGAPLIVNGKVIGVISGTEASQGRTLGWAIPAQRIAQNRRVGKTQSFLALPPLTLLHSGKALPSLKVSGMSERVALTQLLDARADAITTIIAAGGSAATLRKIITPTAAKVVDDTALAIRLGDQVMTALDELNRLDHLFYELVAEALLKNRVTADEIDKFTPDEQMRFAFQPAKPMNDADTASKELHLNTKTLIARQDDVKQKFETFKGAFLSKADGSRNLELAATAARSFLASCRQMADAYDAVEASTAKLYRANAAFSRQVVTIKDYKLVLESDGE
jgi:hypothetical protein